MHTRHFTEPVDAPTFHNNCLLRQGLIKVKFSKTLLNGNWLLNYPEHTI